VRYAGTDRDDEGPWFRLGQLEVTTTVAVLLGWAVMLVIFVAEPVSKPINSHLTLDTYAVRHGELWRLATWPFAMPAFGLREIVTAAMFWTFGTELERQTYRVPFLRLFTAIVATYTVFYVVLATLLGSGQGAAGLAMPTFAVVLLYIAEHPNRPFFFGIPAWIIGAVIVALEVLNDVAYRQWTQLLTVLLASVVIALVAKRAGLLSAYDRIPTIGGGEDASPKGRGRSASRRRSGRTTGGLTSRLRRQPDAEIVAMPTPQARPRPSVVVPDTVSADDALLDVLLDKISAGGLDALTDDERRQLDEIRERRPRL
jgi:hypothetical protein